MSTTFEREEANALETIVHFAAGHIHGWLNAFAEATRQPALVLTERVAELLQAPGRPGFENSMPDLHLPSLAALVRISEVESAGSAPSQAPSRPAAGGQTNHNGKGSLSQQQRELIGESKRKWWAKKHEREAKKRAAKERQQKASHEYYERTKAKTKAKAKAPVGGFWTPARRREQAERMRLTMARRKREAKKAA